MNRTNQKITKVSAFLLSLFLLSALLGGVFAAENIEKSTSKDNEDFNLVLLIDRSGSMQTTDHDEFVKNAAKLFIDLCEESGNSQLAVMSFNVEGNGEDRYGIKQSPFMVIGSENNQEYEENRAFLKDWISNITYGEGGTDIGHALKSAAEYLHSKHNDEKNDLIVLFTDGYTQDLLKADGFNSKAEYEEAEREAERKSDEKVREAIQLASEDNCRIFIIGANYQNSMAENGRSALESIRNAQIANGITNKPEELLTIIDSSNQESMAQVVDAFEKIYASIGHRIIHSGDIIIDYPNVTEVNIVITAPEGISRAELTSPNNNTLSLDLTGKETTLDGTRILYKEGASYQVVKMIEPISVGTWTLNVTDKQERPIIDYTWMLTSSTEIEMTLAQQDEANVAVSINLVNVEPAAAANYFNSLIEKKISITDPLGNVTQHSLEYDTMAGCLSTSFNAEAAGGYLVTAEVTDGYFSRNCTDTITIDTQPLPDSTNPTVPPTEEVPREKLLDIGEFMIWQWETKSWDLRDLVGEDIVTCSKVNGDKTLADYLLDGFMLTVKGHSSGTEPIRIHCTARDGTELVLCAVITVRNTKRILFIGIPCLVIIVICLILRHNRRLKGTFRNFKVSFQRNGEKVPGIVIPRGRTFTLYDLVVRYKGEIAGYSSWGNSNIIDEVILNKQKGYVKELKQAKIAVCINRRSFTFDGSTYKIGQNSVTWSSKDAKLDIDFDYTTDSDD